MFRRLRARLDRIEANTHATMKKAQDSMDKVSIALTGLTQTAKAIAEEVLDGFKIEIEPAEKTSPTKINIVLKEPGDEGPA